MEEVYDVVILGTGPAGIQAAIHAARKKVSVLVMGRRQKSSLYRTHIENYCCLTEIAGETLLSMGIEQAERSGARFLDEDVTEISQRDGSFLLQTESGNEYRCSAIVLAMGVSRNRLNVAGERELKGKGISYCVDCDAGFFKGEKVAVVGCESAAVTGALMLLFYTDEVSLICERLEVSEILAERLRASGIRLFEGRKVRKILGDQSVEGVLLDDDTRLDVTGVFIELGAKGAVGLASKLGVALDSETMQYVGTNKKQETNIPGIYAAGDICGPPWQVAKAVGEGCVAGMEAAGYAKKGKA